jgi:hypothetical protein
VPTPPAPRTVEDITAAWIQEVLALAGHAGRMEVPIEVEDLGAGVGLLGTVARVRRPGATAGPASVIVKLPSTDPANLAIVRVFGYDVREAGFYRELAPGAALPAPGCLTTVEGPEGPVLVLEDLAEHERPDQLPGADAAQALRVAELAARIHAPFWESERLTAAPWLPGPTDPRIAGYGGFFASCWDTAAALVGASVDERTAAQAAMRGFDGIVRRFAGAPRTLVHGDLRLDNVLLGPASDEDRAVDWQLAAWGRGAYDLAFFASGSLEPEVRRTVERALVARWHTGLVAAGVRGYRSTDAWLDYRLGLVLNLPNPVTAIVAVRPGNERGRALLEANLRRALGAVRDHWLDPDPALLAASA